jgi:hypothetical protein
VSRYDVGRTIYALKRRQFKIDVPWSNAKEQFERIGHLPIGWYPNEYARRLLDEVGDLGIAEHGRDDRVDMLDRARRKVAFAIDADTASLDVAEALCACRISGRLT